jgi:hypothetical protein
MKEMYESIVDGAATTAMHGLAAKYGFLGSPSQRL